MVNKLNGENSPYLLQHADNPVDWYPWGEEALNKATEEDKPIFLSIGYAACHWCHVMAHESFEDPDTAMIMNDHFVNIKVDREERPDLDSIYMDAVVAMTGQGGWPMSVFLTPDGQPFFGGTYFPPEQRFNMPSFREVLVSVYTTWDQEREKLMSSSQRITDHIRNSTVLESTENHIQDDLLQRATMGLAQTYDWNHGGWGNAPKFPQPLAIDFLLRQGLKGDETALRIATHALRKMAKGGMYDVVGGGFARYSTDNDWLVPHFEKMLYDNALLARVYLHAYLITGDMFFRRICEETLGFLTREMMDPQGGFYSSLDADSEGIEGKYYVWTLEEIKDTLGNDKDAEFLITAYGITERGNFEGCNVLQRVLEDDALAEMFEITPSEVLTKLSKLHAQLLKERERRIPPSTDDKVLVAWNALAVLAISEAGVYLCDEFYVDMATRNLQFVLDNMCDNGLLYRSWRQGQARHTAYLTDYAGLIQALLSTYQAHPNPQWFHVASQLAEEMLEHFSDPAGGFFDIRDDHEVLFTRPKSWQDNATPSGNSQAAYALLQLAAYTGRQELREIAEKMLAIIQSQAIRYPTAFSNWLCAADFVLNPVMEIAILGDERDPQTQAFLDVLWQNYQPHIVLARSDLPISKRVPALLKDRSQLNGQPTAYVCQNFVCKYPVNSAEAFREQLES